MNFRSAISASVLMVPLAALALHCGKGGVSTDDSMDARVYMAIGKVSVNKLSNPRKGDLLINGDEIETGDDGIFEVFIGTGTLLRLGKNTQVIFNMSDPNSQIQLRRGSISGVTKKPLFRDYHISTTTLIAGVNDAFYYITMESPNSTYVCLCRGRMNLHGRGAISGETVNVSAHKALRYTLDSKGLPGVDRNPGLLYHSDAMFLEMEKKLADKGI